MAFGELLLAAIRDAGFTQLGFAERVGSSSGHITNLVKGQRTPNIDAMPVWSDILGLTGQVRERFLLEAKLAHCPADVADILRNLIATRDELLAKLPAIREGAASYAELEATCQAQAQRIADLEARLARYESVQ